MSASSIPLPNTQRTGANGRQIVAATGIIAALSGNLPAVPGVAPWIVYLSVAVPSGILFIVEHFVGDPSTGNGIPV